MNFGIKFISSRKELFVAILSTVILTAIFTPFSIFQGARALSLTTANLDGASFDTSSDPVPFPVRLDIQSGEEVQVQAIVFRIDGNLIAAFNAAAAQLYGTPNGIVTMGKPNAPVDSQLLNCGPSTSPTQVITLTTDQTITTTRTSIGYGYGYGYGYGNGYGYGYGYGQSTTSSSSDTSTSTEAFSISGTLRGPQTITYPATLKPSLLSDGTHELEVTIFSTDGQLLLSSGPAAFNINHDQGAGNLGVFAKHILPDGREQDVPERMAVELRKGLTLLQTQFTDPVAVEEGRSTAASFLINEGTEYSAHARDYGNYVFDHWSDGSTDRTMTVRIEDQDDEPGTESLTAYYRQRAEPPVELSINAVTLDSRTQLLGMFHKISVDDSRDNLFETGFDVANVHTLEPGADYTVFASDCNQYIFDHWESPDNPNVPLDYSVNLRGTAINAGDNINLVAVYRVISPASAVPISSEASQDTTVALQGMPGTGEVGMSLGQAFGTGIVNLAPLAVSDQSGMHWGPLIFAEGNSGRFTGDNGSPFLAAGTLLEVDVSMVVYPDSLIVTLPYDPGVLQTAGNAENMDNIRVFLYDGLAWRDVTVEDSLDASGNTIQGQVPTHLASTPVVVAMPIE